jgi:hypothetical protein
VTLRNDVAGGAPETTLGPRNVPERLLCETLETGGRTVRQVDHVPLYGIPVDINGLL